MTERYYEAEHVAAYARLRREGLTQWNDLHPGDQTRGYEEVPTRPFLERVLPSGGATQGQRVLEYGCGTGAAACFLARRGFEVTAVDLVPDAIAVARHFAAERGLEIQYAVQDVCSWPDDGERFDYVIDNYCLQSIVTDADRGAVLDGARRRLEPTGHYLISTAMHDPERSYEDDHHDPATGMVWTPAARSSADSVRIGDAWFLPHRRHLTATALRTELEEHGLQVLDQSGRLGGELVCGLAA